jgi:hypothetical protein
VGKYTERLTSRGKDEPPKMTKEEVGAFLKQPLDPDLDYYDATNSIKAMADHVREMHRLVFFMFESLALQGASIIDVRQKMVEHKTAIENLADLFGAEEADDALIGLKKPAIIMPGGGRRDN